jgi:hypothetical protein
VPDIIEEVFKTFGCTDYRMTVSRGDYPKPAEPEPISLE